MFTQIDDLILVPYIRTSTDEQGNSIEDQDTVLRRWGELYQVSLTDAVIDEDVSGGIDIDQRPGGQQLIEMLRDGVGNGFVCTAIDRAFRKTIDGLIKSDWFNAKGFYFFTVLEHVDTSHPEGWEAFGHKLISAEAERRKTGYRTRNALRELKNKSRAFGPTPYGCIKKVLRPGCKDEVKKLYRDPEQWAIREDIIKMRMVQELSWSAICAELEANHVLAPNGGAYWHKSTIIGICKQHDALKHIPLQANNNEAEVSLEVVK